VPEGQGSPQSPAGEGAAVDAIAESPGVEADFNGVVWVDGTSKPGFAFRRTLSVDLGFSRVRLTGPLAAAPLASKIRRWQLTNPRWVAMRTRSMFRSSGRRAINRTSPTPVGT
jgi:hypothetical protein